MKSGIYRAFWVLVVFALFPILPSAQQSDDVSGVWTYRSFRNDPSPVGGDAQKALGLIFGEGVFRLELDVVDKIRGTIDFGGYVLDVSGQLQRGVGSAAPLIVLRGTGRKGTPTDGWIYDYQAFPAPKWANGTNQRPALVGSVIRAVPHGGARAGYTASFVAVKAD